MTNALDMDPGCEELGQFLERDADPSEVWEGSVSRKVRRRAYADWIAALSDWHVFLTLTFRDEKPQDSAKSYFKKLVRELNKAYFGKRYSRIVGHSYFSYVMAMEYQLRGVIHLHALIDKPVDFALIHEKWNEWAGFAFTEIIRDAGKSVWYVVKYAVKNGDIDVFKATCEREPLMRPVWWGSPAGKG